MTAITILLLLLPSGSLDSLKWGFGRDLGPLFLVSEKLQTNFFFKHLLQLPTPVVTTHLTFVLAHSSHASLVFCPPSLPFDDVGAGGGVDDSVVVVDGVEERLIVFLLDFTSVLID